MNIEPQSHDSQDHGPWIPWAEARLAIAQNAAHVFDVTLFFVQKGPAWRHGFLAFLIEHLDTEGIFPLCE